MRGLQVEVGCHGPGWCRTSPHLPPPGKGSAGSRSTAIPPPRPPSVVLCVCSPFSPPCSAPGPLQGTGANRRGFLRGPGLPGSADPPLPAPLVSGSLPSAASAVWPTLEVSSPTAPRWEEVITSCISSPWLPPLQTPGSHGACEASSPLELCPDS